ncbi:NAD-dependent epimerase/dehydratase family protein [Agromyces archimandritae]|uniref:NAD(P)-dependent oxidoreductase n=1 Tax=Agromyces archimandritae TaxID=2781962 RepID=A0A975FM61_9MICO|nr:NAD(P)-dependent oxidoreductase [Agromyces archimandritae]QTX03526.1 NAD(P)-dependent oxidoreductase [Agromyces archimandritae]
MRILVTGSAGRLGRSTALGLAAAGHQVTGADRASAGLPGIDERLADLADDTAVAELLAATRPQAIVHLAAIAVPFSAPERRIFAVNTAIAHTVFEAAAAAGVERVLAASSPTVLGYGIADWHPHTLPLDETHPVAPANAYAASKLAIEELARMFARTTPTAFGVFRPCYVITPEEWAGAPTQQGHTIAERLADPALAAVSLFNYVDARDAADFAAAWVAAPVDAVDGETFFVGAADALAVRPVAELRVEFAPELGPAADALTGTAPVFSPAKAAARLGWRPRRSWRDEHVGGGDPASTAPPAAPPPASTAPAGRVGARRRIETLPGTPAASTPAAANPAPQPAPTESSLA